MITRSLLFILLIVSQHLVLADEKIRIHIWGELKNPGSFDIEKNMTLGNLIPKKAIPLLSAATNRIQIWRSGKIYSYNLKSSPAIILKSGDTIFLPIRSWYQEQKSDQEQIVKIRSKNPKESLKKIINTTSSILKIQKNYSGVEFRPKDKKQENWSRVLVSIYYEEKGDKGLIVNSRNWSEKIGHTPKLKYQIDLEQKISDICDAESE